MDIEKLKETRIVSKEEHFLPAVFVDMTIPAAAIAITIREGAKQFENKGKKKLVPIPKLSTYRLMSTNKADKEKLVSSIDDVIF